MRLFLSITLVLVVAGMAAGFYSVYYSFMQPTAQKVAETQAESQSSDAKLQQLIGLQAKLKDYQPIVVKAEQIVVDSNSYNYQNQIISDLTRYAGIAGITITSFNFQDATASNQQSSQSSASTQQQEATPSVGQNMTEGGEQAAGQATAPAPVSTKSMQVSVQLGDSINYRNFLHFIHLIEQNLTRMQVMELSLTKGKDSDTVGTQSLNLEVYVK